MTMLKVIGALVFAVLCGGACTSSRDQTGAGSATIFPVTESDNHRYLVDHQGVPFPILGRTAWFLVTQPKQGYAAFIDHTLSFGYNSIEMSAIVHDRRGNH